MCRLSVDRYKYGVGVCFVSVYRLLFVCRYVLLTDANDLVLNDAGRDDWMNDYCVAELYRHHVSVIKLGSYKCVLKFSTAASCFRTPPPFVLSLFYFFLISSFSTNFVFNVHCVWCLS